MSNTLLESLVLRDEGERLPVQVDSVNEPLGAEFRRTPATYGATWLAGSSHLHLCASFLRTQSSQGSVRLHFAVVGEVSSGGAWVKRSASLRMSKADAYSSCACTRYSSEQLALVSALP